VIIFPATVHMASSVVSLTCTSRFHGICRWSRFIGRIPNEYQGTLCTI